MSKSGNHERSDVPKHVLDHFSIDIRQITRSTFSLGPTYNQISSTGYPVLGALLKAGDLIFSPSIKHTVDAYVPKIGAQLFQGLTANTDGTVDFHVLPSAEHPALILEEDYLTLMALVFSSGKMPKFNLAALQSPQHSQTLAICEKQWNPSWLEFTDFGKTLYYTDRLLGDLWWNSSVHHVFMPPKNSREESFLKQMDVAATKPSAPRQKSSMFCILPKTDTMSGYHHVDTGMGITVLPSDENPWIAGWPDDRWSEHNDDSYGYGSHANFMTNHYDELCAFLPVYERYRQLMRVFFSLCVARDRGFQVNKTWQQSLRRFISDRQDQVVEGNHDRIIDFTPLGWR